MERPYRKLETTPDSLLGCRFFDSLERADRAHISRFCEGRCYRARCEIIRHADTTRDVYFILSGRVNALLSTSTGKVVTLQEIARGEMFGELAAIDGKGRSTSVWTVEETSVIRISGPNFKDMISRIPSLAELTMLRLCDLSRFLCEKAAESRIYSVPDQVRLEICRILSTHPRTNGALTIEPAPTHEGIAQLVGTNREQVTRVMSQFTKSGLITHVGKSWHVSDVNAAFEALLDGI